MNTSTYIQYTNKNQVVKTIPCNIEPYGLDSLYTFQPIEEDFFILGVYDQNKRLFGFSFQFTFNLGNIAFLNSENIDLDIIPNESFNLALTDVGLIKRYEQPFEPQLLPFKLKAYNFNNPFLLRPVQFNALPISSPFTIPEYEFCSSYYPLCFQTFDNVSDYLIYFKDINYPYFGGQLELDSSLNLYYDSVNRYLDFYVTLSLQSGVVDGSIFYVFLNQNNNTFVVCYLDGGFIKHLIPYNVQPTASGTSFYFELGTMFYLLTVNGKFE